MFEEYEKKKRQQVTRMRSIADYGMGILFLLTGFFFLFHSKLKLGIEMQTGPVDYLFGVLAILYGAWRLYRGYTKKYFR